MAGMAPESNPGPPASTHLTTVTDAVGQGFTWDDSARIEVRGLGSEIIIETSAGRLRTLERHLLTLAEDGTPTERICICSFSP
ncbi:hypothetical protein OG937_01180 [Streptomyces sp. NBC_00510]